MLDPPSPTPRSLKLKPTFLGTRARRKVLIATLCVTFLVALPLLLVHNLRRRPTNEKATENPVVANVSETCSAEAFSSGRWVWDPKTSITQMTSKEQALAFSGIESCASDREVWWNLGADREEQWFRFPKVQSYKWEVGSECKGLRALDPGELLKDLVEKGGWYLVGGSFLSNVQSTLTAIFNLFCQTRSQKTTSFLFPAFSAIMLSRRPITR